MNKFYIRKFGNEHFCFVGKFKSKKQFENKLNEYLSDKNLKNEYFDKYFLLKEQMISLYKEFNNENYWLSDYCIKNNKLLPMFD